MSINHIITSIDDGIQYKHTVIPGENNKFTRINDSNCFIEYYTIDSSPCSIYIQSFKCSIEPKGSGRLLMKKFFEFIKHQYYKEINDNTYVLLSPYPSSDKNPIMSQDNYSKLVAYYESLKFKKININGINLWGGTIGAIIEGITNYRKNGGKSKKSRKCKKGKKSRSYKRK